MIRHIEHGSPSRGHHHDVYPPSVTIAKCPICDVTVIRWSNLEGAERRAYVDDIRSRMAEGRLRYLRVRAIRNRVASS